ncbi:MAG: DUF998 domain-containing protein [Acidimicrobiales bacterium]
MKPRQTLAWGGVVGPAGFVAAWSTAGALTKRYSPVQESISRLAAVRAPTRWLMTAGMVCFRVTVPAYSVALRDSLGGPAWLAATATGLATLGAGVVPLGTSSTADGVHYGFAVVGSASLALTPVLAAQTLSARGHGGAAAASRLVGALSGAFLAAAAFPPIHGLSQRIGLTLAEGWLAASAVAIVSGLMEPTSMPTLEATRKAFEFPSRSI